jgi:pimeloyl-ACP methyl ester carboxylesterase
MEFTEKQYDGPYEVIGIEIHNDNQIFKGLLYFPPKPFQKPYPLIIYFHGFPQLFSLSEIVKSYKNLLDIGYAFFVFNFRGYRFSEGEVSIVNQLSDAEKVIEFALLMTKKSIFNKRDINIIAHDFGAYIALLLCSQNSIINKLLLLSPILNLKDIIDSPDFEKNLHYINRFLYGNIHGIANVNEFISKIKSELNTEKYQIDKILRKISYKKIKIILGDKDKLIKMSELKETLFDYLPNLELVVIKDMEHEPIEEKNNNKINNEVNLFFNS